ncbi:MAG: hypothetical protein A3G39_00245 [Deltaproteobacteria bacterium RIFCSPLOWO2_12_FULL_43_16]|nr:MAG: hypothetical protein A2Z89_02660 [Deltaproteobacteria bacterium GWA2_43_19]OGQ10030.1 MAG: hypothetical protein A3D30_08065 [Deltaproteobacteria bacterium RIFCSPHIGHO2_02_FULL_43_33]OGQ58718.1 MAG: hypothetical protein A3G39_00245 [Deltaproteobacteria bacterium RIFCSPLOWO2_12_FULL_43_16]HBR16523.1 hypothetical protein [Deltaproteobacteria bacterium]
MQDPLTSRSPSLVIGGLDHAIFVIDKNENLNKNISGLIKEVIMRRNYAFIEGMSSVLDIDATLDVSNIVSLTRTDLQSLGADWKMVGQDLLDAIAKYEKNLHGEP